MSTVAVQRITAAEYLAMERASEVKHELVDGLPVAMAGATWNHNAISSNAIRALGNELVPHGCQVLGSDMRVGIPRKGRGYFYPDVSVVCGDVELEDREHDILQNPIAILEVLSPSTEAYDRGVKFRKYRTIPSLKVVLLISQDQPIVEVNERKDFNRWEVTFAESLDSVIQIPVLNITVALRDLYARVEFKSAPDEATAGE